MSIYDLPPMSWGEVLGALAASLVIFWYVLRVSRKADRRHARLSAGAPARKKGPPDGRSRLVK